MLSSEKKLRKGPWSPEEDDCLRAYVTLHGERRWDAIATATGLRRSGKSCRLRWLNYLHPGLNHTRLSVQEEHLIIRLHQKWGNKWARIARRLPGRTDNEIKNYWRSYTRKTKTKQLNVVDQDQNNYKSDETDTTQYYCTPNHAYNLSTDDEVKEELVSREELSSSSSAADQNASSESDDVILMRARSPYEEHFSNWMTLLPITAENNGLANCEWSYQEEASTTSAADCLDDTLWDFGLVHILAPLY